ncbi:2-amino-5-chloromuconate deaminase CnbZ [Bradyrhizobium genosp. P]|uniref:2-amino-5-chloromuconate deaminase CnbZ n=1 Tax=Bradyrhizobium genosp. P TaxID=83641 RepID=UPI003CEA5288
MTTTIEAPDSGYRFMPGVSQYSCGVSALPGFAIERVRFFEPVPLKAGFARIADILKASGRPLTAFGACELRSPAPFTEQGFKAFNEIYIKTLIEWGVMRDGVNPVARSNVCPKIDPPNEPSFHAFSYTVPAAKDAPASFVVAGSGESVEGKANYRDHIVALGDTSPAGMLAKAKSVLNEMERRMSAFGGSWKDTTAVQLYTVHDAYPVLESELGRRGVFRNGLTWHFDRPPVVGLDYEMDCRRVHLERVV